MSDACVIAVGAISALGEGHAAYAIDPPDAPIRVGLARDAVLEGAGLHRPLAGRAPIETGDGADRATVLLERALAQTIGALDAVRPGWRGERIGVAIGTSSGGMLTAERLFALRAEAPQTAPSEDAPPDPARAALARGATYFAPLDDALVAAGLARPDVRATQILAACASSTIALGIALRWLDRGACDLVLAGGYDGLSVFVAAGFEALRATTASRPRPFCIGRDGMALGEGAGVVALVRDGDVRGAPVAMRVAGFGASTDAVHITAPDRTGSGLARAARAALNDAGIASERVGLVSAHATATPYNDAMEARALAAVLGSASPIVHAFKPQIGHTLGAAGILESLAASDAVARGLAPATAVEGEFDPQAPARVARRTERHELGVALKLSAAFGGANASLVLVREPSGRATRSLRSVYLRAARRVTSADLGALAEATGIARDRLARLDVLCRLGVAAVAALAGAVGKETLRGAGVIAGHALATIDTNDLFDARRRAKGATAVEPRLFPATSPNAVAGECAIAFGCTGPSFAVGASLEGAREALDRGVELVAAGDADRIVVVAADDAGPVARDVVRWADWDVALERGAVALLLTADSSEAAIEVALDGAASRTAADARTGARPIGHLALVDWLTSHAVALPNA